MLRRLRSALGTLLRRRRFEDAMAEEMRFHVEAYAADLVRAGVPPADAARRARIEFGAAESLKEDCRQSRGQRLADELRQDLRYGWRQMAKAPGFTLAAVLSLALGIGANTALFTIFNSLLLKTLPVREPQQLAMLDDNSWTYPIWEQIKSREVTLKEYVLQAATPEKMSFCAARAAMGG